MRFRAWKLPLAFLKLFEPPIPMKKKPLLDRYIKLIKTGKVVAFPTETVYGLGADARNLAAVQRVFETKGRPNDNPLIVHIASVEMLQQVAAKVPKEAKLLMK